MASTPAVLGLDLGTSEAKAALVGLDGQLLGLGRGTYPTDVGADGRAEQDPRDWWAALAVATRSLAGELQGADVLGVCAVGQGPTLVAVDEAARPVRPALTWQDRRAGAGGYGLLPRMAWLAREDPDGAARARWLLASWDAVGLWLTGEAVTTVQAHEALPSPEELAAAGVPGDVIAPALAFGSRLGSLRPEAAAALGLTAGIPVIAGVNDGAASMLGAGLREPGDAVDTGGTSGGIAIYADRPVTVGRSFVSPAPLAGLWVVGGAMAALGASVDWMRSSRARRSMDTRRAVPRGCTASLPVLTGSCSCRTWRGSARRSSTRRRGACCSGSRWRTGQSTWPGRRSRGRPSRCGTSPSRWPRPGRRSGSCVWPAGHRRVMPGPGSRPTSWACRW